MKTPNRVNLPLVAAGLLISTPLVRGEVVFTEHFESPTVTGFDDNTVPNNGQWIGASQGFGASNRGLYNEEVVWPASPDFETPYGKQAYFINYTNSGLTSAQGVISGVFTEGVSYKVEFNAGVVQGAGPNNYLVELVAFEPTDDNIARKECRSNRPGTIVATAAGPVSLSDMSETGEVTFTPGAGDPSLGKEIGVRLIKSTGSVLYDNLRLVVGHDMNPSPESGITSLGGDVDLSWTNHPANTGTDVWVDVWFGTDPQALTKVVDAGLNVTTTTVNVPSANTYYWRVDSYLDGSSTGTPLTGDEFFFVVDDTDGDGFTDEYELANTNPPSNTALNPGDDLDGDGLTNMDEFNYNTDPNAADTDGDTLDDGAEIAGAGSRPATSPLSTDTDGDGLSDLVETNTGTWGGPGDSGTDPTDVDWDDDGIKDGVETNTGTLVDRFDTGTDPYLADTDGDGAWDWYEVEGALTDPHDVADVPAVPYPLPDPDPADTGNTTNPVKVYILSGQSNMVGIGDVNDLGEPGALSTATMLENKWPNLVDASNNWTERNDVWYEGVVTATAKKWLSIGCGSSSTRVGPELGFGHIVGWHHDEPVIIIKSSQGNRSIAWDFLPPGSQRYTIGNTTYAGYGDSLPSWPATDPPPPPPEPGAWYAGKQYDDCVAEVHNVLNNFSTKFPQYSAQGYEVAGFVWWQGHKDGENSVYAGRYETNLTNLVTALRGEFTAPDAPVVVGTIGFDGGGYSPGSNYDLIHSAQLAVGDPIQHPEFAGTVTSVDTTPFWRELNESPGNQGYHYNNSGETYTLVGDALGRAMLEVSQSAGYLVATYPADDATDAQSGADLVLTFAEDQVAGSGNLTLKNLTDSIDTVIPVTDPRVTISGNQVTIEASDLVDWETDFAVRVDAGFVETTGGTPFPGIFDDVTWNFTTGPDELSIAVRELTDHINGVSTLTAQEIADHKAYFDANFDQFDRSAQTIQDLFTLVETYDSVNGPLWIATGSFSRSSQADDLDWTIYHVMQYLMDEVFTAENLALHEATLDGFKFGSSDRFPGACAPPSDPNNVYSVTVDASYPNTAGWDRQNDENPARRATGAYLAPGTVVTVTVPPALVGQGLEVRVGAHAWDFSARPTVWRLDRSSLTYPIDATSIKVASPLGGGIYLEVPKNIDLGLAGIDITGAVRSPLFSMTSYDQTTVSEWQTTERNHPAPWTDFRTENFMVQVPTAWVYAYDDPSPALADWSLAMDTYNDLMGFPRVRGKESLYLQVDVINRNSVFSPGYPSVNFSSNNPTADNYGGHRNTYLVNGPRTIPNWEFHEAGHGYRFPKFGGETESSVNLPHAAIMNQCFGVDIDTAHADSLGFAGNSNRTMNNTAVAWMTSFNFSPREVEMASGEKAYQLKGHAKFVDVARMFGWDKVNAFWKTYVDEYEATGTKPSPDGDTMTLDLSKAVGKDMRPLLHFWGIFPNDPVALEASINAEGLQASAEVFELLTYYKAIVPADNAAFQAFAQGWWGHVPDPLGNWTESEHGRQWDTTDWATPYGKVVQRPNGEIFDATASAEVQARVQEIIDLYFPSGNPDPGYSSPPSPDPMAFATAPYGVDPVTISMTAYPAVDIQGPVEFYFENVTTSDFRDWSTDQDWTNSGLTVGVDYDFRVKARDALGNETAWSPVATSQTEPDTTPPALVTVDPADGTSNVDVFEDLTVTFDEDVAPGAGSVTLRNLTDSSDTLISVTDGTQVSFAGSAVVIDPANDLEAGKSYAILIDPGAITDVWGNGFAGITDNLTWNFSTALTPQETILVSEDFESPDVDASAGVGDTNGTIPDSGNWVGATQGYGANRRGITDKSGGDFSAPDPNFQAFAFRYTNSGLTSAEGVIGALAAGVNYEVSVDVVRDDGKNAGTPYTMQLVAMDPGDNRADCSGSRPGAVLASVSGNAPSDGSFATATLQFTAAAGDPSLGKDLAVRFLGATTSAIIDNVEVKTVETGGADGVPPAVAALSPVDGAVDVAVDTSLVVTFDEDIAAGTGLITLKNLTDVSQSTIDVNDAGQVAISETVMTITPGSPLLGGKAYAVQIAAGALEDLFGNAFGGIGDDTTWNLDTVAPADTNPPTPDPMTFAVVPTATGTTSITMTATTASDPSGVEYYFTCTAGGGSDSGWQDSPSYTDTGLTPETQYTYTVMARDKSAGQNATAPSAEVSATTDTPPDATPPAPDPMTFAVAPSAAGTTSITMTATTASDPSGVEYYFTCTAGGGNDSGWQDSPGYTDSGLTPDTQYSYTVMARDKSAGQNTTAPSAVASATTDADAVDITEYASADIPVAGTVTGGASDTQASDNSYQAITEIESGGKPSNRHSYLEHKWAFTVTGGTSVTFSVEAHHSANGEGDDFTFAYSTSGADGTYTDMVTVTKTSDDNTAQTFFLPAGVSGQVHVRVVDADRSEGNRSLDTLFIDEMHFLSAGGTPDTDPPAPDPMTFASAPAATGSSSIVMMATTATDSNGVEYYFTETSGNPGGTDSGWQDSPSYTDTGLTPETQYSYTVTARDKSSNQNTTAPSVPASTTTDVATDTTDYASADIPVAGTVTGSASDTQASDNSYQAITEIESGGKPSNRHSYLEHKWSFTVTGGTTVTFHVEAHHSANSEGDDFTFAYSTSGADGSYTNMVTVTKTSDDDTTQSFVLPGGTSGTVHVRVVDTNQAQGTRNLDTIFIDRMYFSSEVGGAELLVPTDADLWALEYPGVDPEDPEADLDRDGLSDREEYLWGLEPDSAASVQMIQMPLDATSASLRYTRREPLRTGATFAIWISHDLETWIEDEAALQVVEATADAVETVKVTLGTSPSQGRLFVQVRASE